MICNDCKNSHHSKCKGGTHCFCQHKTGEHLIARGHEKSEVSSAPGDGHTVSKDGSPS